MQDVIDRIVKGDIIEIENGLNSDNPFLISNSIMSIINNKIQSNDFNEIIAKKNCYDDVVAGIRLSTIYDVALDLLGIEKYNGDESAVEFFIKRGAFK